MKRFFKRFGLFRGAKPPMVKQEIDNLHDALAEIEHLRKQNKILHDGNIYLAQEYNKIRFGAD